MNKKIIYVVCAILLQLILLWWIIYRYQSVLSFWDRVVVPVQFYDPRDVFRWDYVTLSYSISRFTWENLNTFVSGDYKWYYRSKWEKIFIIPKMSGDNVIWVERVSKYKPTDAKIYFQSQPYNYLSTLYTIKLNIPTSSWIQMRTFDTSWISYDYTTWDLVRIYYVNPEWITWFKSQSAILNLSSTGYDYKYSENYITWTVQSISSLNELQVDYWADRFFIKEWSWRDLEEKIRENKINAIWRVKDWKIIVEALETDWKLIK